MSPTPKRQASAMSERSDAAPTWTAYEVSNGEYVVCERGNPHAWLRSDAVVPLPDSEHSPAGDDETHVRES
ncbi:DUF7331 family protein [Halorientalis brevis]|nr:hypothetical protein [Halorientalis brevis]